MNGPLERSRLAAVAFSGSYVGTVLALPVSGLLAQHLGWEWIFYFFGILGLVWCIGWMYIVKDNPEEDRNITDQELEYLRTGEDFFFCNLILNGLFLICANTFALIEFDIHESIFIFWQSKYISQKYYFGGG